jgi:NAD(P)-dependent dehydrogenase (short-subunit alcohol dehydrogenase family)
MSMTAPLPIAAHKRRGSRRCAPMPCLADAANIFAKLQPNFGGLDVLVNNAGISGPTKPV